MVPIGTLYRQVLVLISTITRDWPQAVAAQRIDPMLAIISALTLLAASWLRKRTAAANTAQKRAVS